jgi:hypothetical protein
VFTHDIGPAGEHHNEDEERWSEYPAWPGNSIRLNLDEIHALAGG